MVRTDISDNIIKIRRAGGIVRLLSLCVEEGTKHTSLVSVVTDTGGGHQLYV